MHKKKVVWQWEYDVYVPFCPYCGELAYEEDHCVFCGRTYEWVEGKHKPKEVTKGEYTIVQHTNNHINLYRDGKMVMHAACMNPLTEEELLEMIDKYPAFLEAAKRHLEKRKANLSEKEYGNE